MKKTLLIIALLLSIKGFGQNITVSPNTYTPGQLVTDILVKNSCLAQVSNVTKTTGTDYGYAQGNGIAYFQNTNPNFPITSGVMLSTGNAVAAQGPNTTISSFTSPAWAGDADLQAALAAQGITMTSRNATVLEFDFVAITPDFSVDFLFASEEYGTYQCDSKDAFAFLLTNLNTNVTTNVAVVPSTTQPISIATIRNIAYNSACASQNPQFFGLFNGGGNAATSATNFEGQTTLLNASHSLVVGNQYHIKLVIADDAGINGTDGDYDSAVFFPEGSFNLGHEVVGEDLTAANGTGLCNNEVRVIDTGLSTTDYTLSWTKDGAPVTGGSTIAISQTGTYVLTIYNAATNCTATQTLLVEAADPILANQPEDLLACQNAGGSYVYDLNINTPIITAGLNAGTIVTYHTSEADANANANALPGLYTSPGNQTIWARVKSYNTDCYVLVSFQLLTVVPPVANQAPNLLQCSTVGGGTTSLFNLTQQDPAILGTQQANQNTISYFTTMANAVNNTNAIPTPGNYTSGNQTIYARIQRNFSVSCYAITSFTISVTTTPVVPELPDVNACGGYILPNLANNVHYYTGPGGTGTLIPNFTYVTTSQTIYLYKAATVAPFCPNETSFELTVVNTSATTPSNVTACQSYTLPTLLPGRFYYTGPGGTGTQIANGTVITTTQVIYFFVPTAAACTQNANFTVTILPSPVIPNPGNMNLCQPYTLPALTTGNYYTGPGGSGILLPSGTVISTTQTIYIYAQTAGTTPVCTSENSFTVTINDVTIPPIANVANCGPYTLPDLPFGGYFTGPNGTGTALAAGSQVTTSQTVYAYSQSTANPACTSQQTFTVTINPLPTFAVINDVEACTSYTLPALPAGAGYYNQTGGVDPIAAGTVLTQSQIVYAQSAPNQFGCVRERAFSVAVIGPIADNPGNHSVCGSYNLPGLPVGNYYTGPNQTGTLLQAGTDITSTQTIYVYAVSQLPPFCVAQASFTITITPLPVVPAVNNVVACTSYTLPALPSGTVYRTQPEGAGTVLAAGTSITTSQTIYVFKQTGGTPNCTAETSFTVSIITGSIAPASATLCSNGSYTLPDLAMGNYYTQPNGGGTLVAAGTVLTTTTTLYAYVPVTTGTNCTSNNSFTITFLPPVIADDPPNVTSCGSYTLPPNVDGLYYTGANGSGNYVPAGTVITTSQTLFTYNFNPAHPSCRVYHSFVITITGPNVTDIPDQMVCASGYVLPPVTVGHYYSQPNGAGPQIPAGTTITATQTIYIYAQTGTTFICSDQESFTVTIMPTPQIPPSAVVAACGSYILPALSQGNYYTGTNGTGTMLAPGQAVTSTQNIYIYAESGGTFNCTVQSILQVIINPQAPANVYACDSYVLPALTFGNYFNGPAGTGTPLFAGNVINSTQNIYVYLASTITPNCTDNNFFTVTISQTPVIAPVQDVVRCDAYELPALAVGNYYTGPAGTGSLLNAGTVLTASQMVYIYAQTGTSPNCTDEASFNLTIHITPIADARSAVEICNSYTLTPLVTGNYYALPGGPNVPGQVPYSAGDVITSSMTMYIYAQSSTSAACFSQNSFYIDIQFINADNPGPHEDCDNYTLPALTVGDYYTLSGGPDVPNQVLMHAGDVITASVTLYIYAELGGRLNCNDEHPLPITIYQTPVVDDTQGDLSVCFTYTLPPLTVGNYFTATNGGGTPMAAGDEITQSRNIYIYAATGSATKICSDEHMYHLTVNSIDVPEIADFYACETHTLQPLSAGNYFTQPQGQGTMLPVGTVITETQTIYIFGETNTIPNCTDESDFTVTIVHPPLPTFPQPLVLCAIDDLGHGVFNLIPALTEAINGQPDVAAHAYETVDDAQFGVNPITTESAYHNIFAYNQTVYIRLESTLASGCFTIVTVNLVANPRPIAIEPSAPYALCDNGASDTDGLGVFDLTIYQNEVLGTMSPALFSVSYFSTAAAAELGTSPIPSPANYIIGTSSIFIRVTNNTTGCYDVVELQLIVNPLPVVVAPTPYSLCDNNNPGDEIEIFDLTTKIDEITNSALGVTATFYHTFVDAQGGVNAITTPEAYPNATTVETLFVRITNDVTGCYRIVLLDIRVVPLPVINLTVQDLTVCDTNGQGVGTFNLTELVEGLINNGGADLTIHFYESATDAANGLNEIPNPASYQNIIPFSQPIYIVVENGTTGCQSNVYTFTLIVEPAPQAPALPNLVACDDTDNDDQDAHMHTNLAQQDQVIYDALDLDTPAEQATVIIHYFTSEANANAGAPRITNPLTYNAANGQVIWVRVEDAVTGCYSISSFTVIINAPVDVIQPTPLVVCNEALPNDATAIFDLTTKNTEILGPLGIGMGNTVTYYTTNANAQAGTNPISAANAQAYTNTSNPQTLFVVVTTPAGCKSYTTLTIRVLPLPVPNFNPAALTECDDDAVAGTEDFNLTQAAADILANDSLSVLSYYPTEADANAGTNEILTPATYNSATGSVWVKVAARTTNATDPVCYQLVELQLIVNPLPATGTIAPYAICEPDTDGFATFDFNTHLDELLGATANTDDYTVTFYYDLAAYNAGTPLPYIYTNQVATHQVVYVHAVNDVTGCENFVNLDLYVEEQALANPVTQATLDTYFDICDTDGTNDGFDEFDLTQATADVIGTQTPVANYTVTYYETEADAQAGTNAIATPEAYTNTTALVQTIWVRIINNTTITGCPSFTSFNVVVEQLAEPVITTPDNNHTICVDFTTGDNLTTLVLDSGITTAGATFKWFLDGVEVTVDPASATFEAFEAGSYTVEVTGPAPNACVSGLSAAFVVTQSGPASIIGNTGYVVSNAFSDTQTITVLTQGYGEYQYSLYEDGPWQNSNVFTNVPAGPQTIYIRDNKTDNPCDVLILENVSIIDYPHYFTPNGDGYHETWNIIGLENYPAARIYIFDRYGKLLKQVSPESGIDGGWDGTFNGKPMPADDYWFTVTYPDGNLVKEFKAHFTLKR